MKNLLFFTAAALLLVESTVAYADPPGQNVWERGGGEERFPPLPPQPQTAYPRGSSPGYITSYGYSPNQGGGDVGYCMRRFRSYDPRSGTYLGFDGLRHRCP